MILGHSTYTAFMVTESLLNNPIVHVFVNLMTVRVKQQKFKYYTEEKSGQ